MSIHKNECVGIQGASAIGKTTLFNLLLAFILHRKGRYE
ncbi:MULTISPECIES: hypothetical protein [unclassified Dysgonomonas]